MIGLLPSIQFPAKENPLLAASPGLMIWTILMFFLTLFILKKYVFGPLGASIEKRRTAIQQSIEEAESTLVRTSFSPIVGERAARSTMTMLPTGMVGSMLPLRTTSAS